MTLQDRLARQRARRERAAHNFDSNTAKIKTLVARLQRRPKLGVFLADRFNLRVTSTYRTPEHNRAVGGVPNSWHTKARGKTLVQKLRRPAATDLVGTEANMAAASAWVAANVPGVVENFVHDVGSGRHLHIAGWGVADWDWPQSGELKGLRRRRARNERNVADATRRIDRIKAAIAARRPVPAKGFDVSNHQVRVDFAAAKADGWDFVWLRAGEGATGPTAFPGDATFLPRVREAKAAGLKVGAYWFLHPKTSRSGAEEARAFHRRLVQAGLGAGDLVPVLDIEVKEGLTDDEVRQYAAEAYDELRALTGRKVAIYSFTFFLTRWPLKFARAPLWIADFRGLAAPGIPAPWSKAAAWQWTSKGREPWVSGDLDKNKTDDLRKLIA